MIYNMMLNIADKTISQYRHQGTPFQQDATVCVISTGSQHIYTGISRSNVINGAFVPVHAEVTAIQNMLAGGDSYAEYIFLMGIVDRRILIPCNQCIQYLLSCSPQNSNCQAVLPDRTISLMNANNLPQENPIIAPKPHHGRPTASRMNTSVSMPVSVSSQRSNSEYLKSRVTSLMASADEYDEPEEPPKKKKGLLDSLFGKG